MTQSKTAVLYAGTAAEKRAAREPIQDINLIISLEKRLKEKD